MSDDSEKKYELVKVIKRTNEEEVIKDGLIKEWAERYEYDYNHTAIFNSGKFGRDPPVFYYIREMK